jgi:GNAT superfamily N-acetyltransferase
MKANLKYDPKLYAFEKKYVAGRRSRLEKKLHSGKVGIFVAEENGKYCGYLLVEKARHPVFLAKNEAHVDDVFVIPPMRRKGVGKLLLARAEAWAKENGMDYLGIETDAKNVPAAAAYRKAGFAPRRLRMIKWL